LTRSDQPNIAITRKLAIIKQLPNNSHREWLPDATGWLAEPALGGATGWRRMATGRRWLVEKFMGGVSASVSHQG